MDLQDFEGQLLYFDMAAAPEVGELIRAAAEAYGDGDAEPLLLQAYKLAPTNLSVLVGLYRFYYYQHRYEDALHIAHQAMTAVAPIIHFPDHWSHVTFSHLSYGVLQSFTLVRFYLLAVKGGAYLNLRMGNIAEGVMMLNKVVELDSNDRLGAKTLLQSVGPAVVYQKVMSA